MSDLDDASVAPAESLVAAVERQHPGAVELARVLSYASRIEPALLRAVRLHVLSHLRAGDEARLWTSELVQTRGLDGVVLRADVAEVLRGQARAVWLNGGPAAARLLAAHDEHFVAHHAGLPPLVQLEERIGWLAITEAHPPARMEAELEVALAALVHQKRVGVARWAARAVPRLPAAARATTAAWQLAAVAAHHLPPSRQDLGVRPPPGTTVVDLAAIAPYLDDAPLGVRRLGDRLELGAVGPGGVAVRVPASEPRFIEVDPGPDGEAVHHAVASGSRAVVDVGWDGVSLRSARGVRWHVPVLEQDEEAMLGRATLRLSAPDRGVTWLGTALSAVSAVTVVPAAARGAPAVVVLGDGSGRPVDVGGIPVAAGMDYVSGELPADSVPLPLTGSVPVGERVVSLGLDGLDLVPVVGTWGADPEGEFLVTARSRATAQGCVGAPVVRGGGLAGVVVAAEAAQEGLVRLRVSGRRLDLVVRGLSPTTEPVLTIELLPAGRSTSVLVAWGRADQRHALLVDGGPRPATDLVRRVRASVGERLDLVIGTHPDADRIEGLTELLDSRLALDDVWFNGPAQLGVEPAEAGAGPTRAVQRFLDLAPELNRAFSGRAIAVDIDAGLPVVELPGGARITVLGPSREALGRLARLWGSGGGALGEGAASSADESPPEQAQLHGQLDVWERYVASVDPKAADPDVMAEAQAEIARLRSAIVPSKGAQAQLGGDASVSNQASIAVLVEYDGRSVVAPGDSGAEHLAAAISRLARERGTRRLFVDCFVLPHAGSRHNVSAGLLELIEADTYAIGTDGSRFHHPDVETIEAIGRSRPGATVAFNYRTAFTANDEILALAKRFDLRLIYPSHDDDGDLLIAPLRRARS